MAYEDYQIEIGVATAVTVIFVLSFFLRETRVMQGVLTVAGVGWVIYRAIGWSLYRFARRAWKGAAEELGLEYSEATTRIPIESTSWTDDLAMFVILASNTRMDFFLDGRIAGEPIEVETERAPPLGRSTIIEVDFSDAVPDWLTIRKGWGSASSRHWLDVEDVLVGDRTFDDHFRVQGRDKRAIREFFVDHPIAEVLVDLGSSFHNIELVDGKLRIALPTVIRRISSLVDHLETVADHAARLRERLEGSETVAEVDSDEEAEERSEVHVYEASH